MANDFWEQAVETFLTIDRGLFVNPQYVIGKPGSWEASADFLALEFPASQAWMVEVTRSPGPGLKAKVVSFANDYEHRIRSQLERHLVKPSAEEWDIGLWLFAPNQAQKTVTSWMKETGKKFRFTALELTTFPDWDSRWRE